ncbi:RND family efflux transporter, MFP subunit [Cohaesibacter sp. ES.047]|uniref:efflux RND transporter periplasmic adaptor subunit n=1 Tax=Cohaesibacter sp. ES.047 TaxID=1798205 RepID=UPI000BB726C6|nr:efflux RND transporter periplasmic adaptor subunit [Cohaesibacter sp. ES.047]SNY92575.1 RND family efflux transporter, MFP subunit [Cohaesibacter sp. ES.047]
MKPHILTKRRATLLIAGPIVASLLACQYAWAQTGKRPVKLMKLEPQKERVERRFFGQIRARETVDLAFQVGGQIVEFPVKEGSQLEKGELVARLDTETFERALRQAKLNLKKTERELKRYKKLQGSSISRTQVEDARTAFELAEIEVEQAERQLEDATLHAPFNALVARRAVPNFTTVSAGTAIVRLQDISEWRVDIDIPEILAQRSNRGNVAFQAQFPEDKQSFPLQIREFETDATSITQTYKLTLALIDAPQNHTILPGSSVSVRVVSASDKPDRIVLPKTALIYDSEGAPGVMLYHPSNGDEDSGTVSREPVEIETDDNAAIVLKKGPPEGSEIVSAGASLLEEGQSVRRFTGFGE